MDTAHRSIPPPSPLEDLLDLTMALPHFRDQNTIVLGDLNADIQAQNPRSQKVAELLIQFGLVDFQQHLDSSDGGGSDVEKLVSEAGQKIVGRKVGGRRHGRNKGREKVYRSHPLSGYYLTANRYTRR